MTEWCTSSSLLICPTGTNFVFEVTSGLKNPSFKSPNIPSLDIATFNAAEDAIYDQINTGVFITPALILHALNDIIFIRYNF